MRHRAGLPLLGLLAALAVVAAGRGGAAPGAPASATPAPPARAEAVAAALRAGDLARTVAALEPGGGAEPRGARAQLLAGLAAHEHGREAEAARWLAATGDEAAAAEGLSDWRLLALGEAAFSLGQLGPAREAYARLLAELPASPLRPRARVRLVEALTEAGALVEALAEAEAGRAEALGGEASTHLESAAWELAGRLGDVEARRVAARRLLALAPLEASRLQAVDALRDERGDWLGQLRPDELLVRAASLLALELAPSALETLEAVAEGQRGLRWYELRGAALGATGRPEEAYALLASVRADTPDGQARLELARARAAEAAATPVGGRTPPPASARARYRLLAEQHLRQATVPGADPDTARAALRALYAGLQGDERYGEGIAVLAELLKLDPADGTGARHLFERGWREYRARNYTGAIGHWTELHSLYPRSTFGRGGRYWTARAFTALGERGRGEAILAEVAAAEPTDFYARHAQKRLRGEGLADDEESELAREPWPDDPRLGRARKLTDLGLDQLALAELALHEAEADRRARAALEGLVLARQGERRESLRLLRRAFPKLGTAFQAEVPPEAVALFYPLDFEETVRRHAEAQRLPVHLVMAVIHQESAFDPNAKSRSGARGLMQVMPATGRDLARQLRLRYSVARLYEPDYSVQLGTTYLRQMLRMFDGRVELALAGYNGGPGRIRQLWRMAGPEPELDAFVEGLTIEESKNYVKRILVLADGYRRHHPTLG
jgi:soluble lytic murein transglycosylase-like protein